MIGKVGIFIATLIILSACRNANPIKQNAFDEAAYKKFASRIGDPSLCWASAWDKFYAEFKALIDDTRSNLQREMDAVA